MRRLVPYAITYQQVMLRDSRKHCSTIRINEFEDFVRNYSEMGDMFEKPAALVIAYYLRTPWSDAELAEHVRTLLDSQALLPDCEETMRSLLEYLGEKP
ncbi:MAG: hypothetical protein ICV60_10960 [Pyrinomonadaceae bacterium]|nr:hypothetical protein [Pyrinomonadaceae bacterium]